jgi:predicted DNA-binding ribbon-helix-helix protein
MKREYKKEAALFIESIKTIAQKENNLENLESYLSIHFNAWLEKFANTPEKIAAEIKAFATMDI